MTSNITELLKKFNLKITKNRITILELFLDDHQFHTITEITTELKMTNTKSIYNNIQIMTQVGLLESFSVSGEVYYEIVDLHKLDKNQAHLITDGHLHHLDLPEHIFSDIEKYAKAANKKPHKIKIIIEE